LAAGTLKLPGYPRVEVLNIERDAAAVFATDEEPAVEEPADEPADAPASGAADAPVPAAAPSASGPATQTVADLPFTAADATRVLIAWWTKLRLDQLGAADTRSEEHTSELQSRENIVC